MRITPESSIEQKELCINNIKKVKSFILHQNDNKFLISYNKERGYFYAEHIRNKWITDVGASTLRNIINHGKFKYLNINIKTVVNK